MGMEPRGAAGGGRARRSGARGRCVRRHEQRGQDGDRIGEGRGQHAGGRGDQRGDEGGDRGGQPRARRLRQQATAGGAAAAVAIGDTALGKVLTDDKGMTLYVFKNDVAGSGKSAC